MGKPLEKRPIQFYIDGSGRPVPTRGKRPTKETQRTEDRGWECYGFHSWSFQPNDLYSREGENFINPTDLISYFPRESRYLSFTFSFWPACLKCKKEDEKEGHGLFITPRSPPSRPSKRCGGLILESWTRT